MEFCARRCQNVNDENFSELISQDSITLSTKLLNEKFTEVIFHVYNYKILYILACPK